MKFGEHEVPGDVPHPCAGGQVDEGAAVLLAEDTHPAAALPHSHSAHHLLTSRLKHSRGHFQIYFLTHKNSTGFQRKMNYITLSFVAFEVLIP